MKDIEIIIKKVNGKITMRVINITDSELMDYSEKDIAKSPDIKECCEILLRGFSEAIEEIKNGQP